MILFSSQVIVPRTWRTIRDEVGCRNTIIEFDHDRSRILDLITANRVTRSSINARDLHTSGVVQIVDIVHRVDEERTATLFRVPFHIPIVIRFRNSIRGLNADQITQLTRSDEITQEQVLRGRTAMMADEQRGICLFAHRDDLVRLFYRVGNGLFEQDIANTRIECITGRTHMQAIRQRDRNRIERYLIEQLGIIRIERHLKFCSNVFSLLTEASNRHQIIIGILLRIARASSTLDSIRIRQI